MAVVWRKENGKQALPNMFLDQADVTNKKALEPETAFSIILIHIHLACLQISNNILTHEEIKYHLDKQLQTCLTIFIQKLIPRPPVWRTTTLSTPITNPQKVATDCCHCINLIPIVLRVFNSWLGLMGWLLGYLQCHSDKVAWLLHSKRTPLSLTTHLPFDWLNRRVNNSNHESRRRQDIITPFV